MILCLKSKKFAFTNSEKNEIIDGEMFFAKKIIQIIENYTSSKIEDKWITLEIESNIKDFQNIGNERVELFYWTYHKKIMKRKMIISSIKEISKKTYLQLTDISLLLNQPITNYFSKECRANFCDAKCKLKVENYIINGIVRNYIKENLSIELEEEIKNEFLFKNGTLVCNQNQFIILHIANNVIFLGFNIYNIIFQKGEKVNIIQGCDKKFNTCKHRFNNNKNFAGEPLLFDKFASSFFTD